MTLVFIRNSETPDLLPMLAPHQQIRFAALGCALASCLVLQDPLSATGV